MKKSTIALLGALGAVLVVLLAFVVLTALTLRGELAGGAASGWKAPAAGGWNRAESTEVVAAPVTAVVVENVSGPVRIESWTDPGTRVHYVKEARGPEALEQLEVEIRASGGTLHVRAVYPRPGGNRYGPVSFSLSLPETVERIEVRSVSGGITVSRLGWPTDQHLRTVSGRVESLGSRNLDVQTVSGRIEFAMTGGDLEVESTSGGVEGRILGLEAGARVEVHTVSGGVRLKAFEGLDARVTLKSGSGGVASGFPLQVSHRAANRLEGVAGAGTVSLRVETLSGGIQLDPL